MPFAGEWMIKLYIGNIMSLYDEIIFEKKCNEVGELRIEKIKNCKMKKKQSTEFRCWLVASACISGVFF